MNRQAKEEDMEAIGPEERIDDEMKRILDAHAAAAEKDRQYVPLRQLVEEGLAKLKQPAPR